MAKDPAFLFYTSDFYMGTIELDDAQVGQYIRLMCLQHQKGHLKKAALLAVMGGEMDPAIVEKFEIDEDGNYFNKRLEEETDKRRKFSESRRNNRNKATPDNLSIYLIRNNDDGLIKIGSSNNPERRLLELQAQMRTKNIELLASVEGVTQQLEKDIQKQYIDHAVFNEWYRIDDMMVQEIIDQHDMISLIGNDMAEQVNNHMMDDMNNHMTGHMVNENENEDVNINTSNLGTGTKRSKVPKKPPKHKYGQYKNVLLSEIDMEKLKNEFPDYLQRIEKLSEYIESKGAKYNSHLATIRAWARKDEENGVSRAAGQDSRTGYIELDNGIKVLRL